MIKQTEIIKQITITLISIALLAISTTILIRTGYVLDSHPELSIPNGIIIGEWIFFTVSFVFFIVAIIGMIRHICRK